MFTKLLVPLDGSALAERAIGPAALIARASGAAIELVLVHDSFASDRFKRSATERQYLATIARELRNGAAVVASHAVLESALPIDCICEHARAVNADLVVMTSHGRAGLSRAWTGSVMDGVLRRASIPVLVIRPADEKAGRLETRRLFKRIMVTLDGSPFASKILAGASALARCNDATIMLLQVVQPVRLMTVDVDLSLASYPRVEDAEATGHLVDRAKQHLGAVAAALAAEGIAVETEVVIADHVASAIVDWAHGCRIDAIAMSTHGHGPLRLLQGSVAEEVLRASDVPLLLQRPIVKRAEPPLLDAIDIEAQLPALSGV